MIRRATMAVTAVLLLAGPARAQEGFPDFDLSGLVDFRAAATDDAVSWLDGGLGKLRYGARTPGDSRAIARLAQANLIARAKFSWAIEGGRPSPI